MKSGKTSSPFVNRTREIAHPRRPGACRLASGGTAGAGVSCFFPTEKGFLLQQLRNDGVFKLIQGKIDALTRSGLFLGWVRDGARPDACRVQMMYAGETVADAIASLFNRSVLQSGHGHGHHGFRARLLRPLPPGPGVVTMHLPAQGAAAPMPVDVPELDPPAILPVEDMLCQPPGWTAADVAANLACLYPEANCARLGPERFTDAVFRFVFGRWPSEAESWMNTQSLTAGRLTPRALLLECLTSRERTESASVLPGPFDPGFPFTLNAHQPSTQAALS